MNKIRLGIVALVALTVLLTALSFQRVSLAATTEEMAVSRALLWLRTQQQADGSIPNAVSGAYNGTTQAVLTIVAGNQDPHTWLSSNNQSPLDYLASQVVTQTDTITETGTTARLTLAVVAAGDNPYNFGGVNLVQRLQSDYNSSTGQYGLAGDVVAQSLSIMALSAAVTDTQPITHTIPTTATNLLKSWQQTNGGWNIADPCVCAAPAWPSRPSLPLESRWAQQSWSVLPTFFPTCNRTMAAGIPSGAPRAIPIPPPGLFRVSWPWVKIPEMQSGPREAKTR